MTTIEYEKINASAGLQIWGYQSKVNLDTVSEYREQLHNGEDIGPIPVVSWDKKLVLTRFNRSYLPSEKDVHERLTAYILEDQEIPIMEKDNSRVHLRANRQLAEIIEESMR